jgi:hypothetical protein
LLLTAGITLLVILLAIIPLLAELSAILLAIIPLLAVLPAKLAAVLLAIIPRLAVRLLTKSLLAAIALLQLRLHLANLPLQFLHLLTQLLQFLASNLLLPSHLLGLAAHLLVLAAHLSVLAAHLLGLADAATIFIIFASGFSHLAIGRQFDIKRFGLAITRNLQFDFVAFFLAFELAQKLAGTTHLLAVNAANLIAASQSRFVGGQVSDHMRDHQASIALGDCNAQRNPVLIVMVSADARAGQQQAAHAESS